MCVEFFSLWKFGNSSAVYKPKITHKFLPTKLYSETGPRVSDFSSLVFRNTNVRGIFIRQHDGAELKMAEVALVKKRLGLLN
jgi:hypothetical protein